MATKASISKILITLIITQMLIFVPVSTVLANGGPHTGKDAGTTDCALCHRSNAMLGTQTTLKQDATTMCLSCHGTGLGANTNVMNGVYTAGGDNYRYNEGLENTPNGAPLLGGGFSTYMGKPVSSAHNVMGKQINTVSYENTGLHPAYSMSCVSCHDPHGSSNYRMLREHINGHTIAITQVDEGAKKDYASENWGKGIDSLCIACHSDYNTRAPNSAVETPEKYTHHIGIKYSDGNNVNPETIGYKGYHLPLAESGINDSIACMTCHLPHGTSATMSDGRNSNLLRLDNSGVCQVCHQK